MVRQEFQKQAIYISGHTEASFVSQDLVYVSAPWSFESLCLAKCSCPFNLQLWGVPVESNVASAVTNWSESFVETYACHWMH